MKTAFKFSSFSSFLSFLFNFHTTVYVFKCLRSMSFYYDFLGIFCRRSIGMFSQLKFRGNSCVWTDSGNFFVALFSLEFEETFRRISLSVFGVQVFYGKFRFFNENFLTIFQKPSKHNCLKNSNSILRRKKPL